MDADDSPQITGLLQKRRGGFSKMVFNSWQYRFFTVTREGVLLYYDTDMPEVNIYENKPRGKLELKQIQFELVKNAPIEGAPTSFTIQICPSNDEKWKLCADSKEDLNRWCNILEKYVNEKPNGAAPVSYTSDEDDGTRPSDNYSNPMKERSRSIVSTLKPSVNPLAQIVPGGSNKTFNSASRPFSTTITASNLDIVKHSETVKKDKKRLKVSKKTGFIEPDTYELILVTMIFNLCIYMSTKATTATSSDYLKYLYLILANVIVIGALRLRGYRTHTLQTKLSAAIEEKSSMSSLTAITAASPSIKLPLDISVTTTSTSNSTPNTPITTSVALQNQKPKAGATLQQSPNAPMQSPDHTWCRCDYRLFNVRIGPEYNRYKKKAPSSAPLFDCIAVDIFCTKTRADHAAPRFTLPDTSHINTYNQHVPPYFIIQIQIPSEAPPMFATVEDGPGWAILMYFMITEDTCKQLSNLATASPAVRLFAQYCEKAPIDPLWRGRFKVICNCLNLEELGMPSAITTYNAKPVLIRRTGSLVRGSNYLEMDIHVHKFNNVAKQCIHTVSTRCGLMYMQIGFVIEGRDDKELPETIFGCVGVNKPQEDNADFIFDD